MESQTATHTLTEREAARYIGMSVSFLRLARIRKSAPAYIKIGSSIRYRVADLDAFLNERVVRPGASSADQKSAVA